MLLACLSGSALANDVLHPGAWAGNHWLACAETGYGCPEAITATASVAASPVISTGNYVGFWQSVMSADGFGVCIDGKFGPLTMQATRQWQKTFAGRAPVVDESITEALEGATHFYVDGIVGPQTWSAAQTFVVPENFGADQGNVYDSWYYFGTYGVVDFFYNVLFPDTPRMYFYPPPYPNFGSQESFHPAITLPAC